MVCDNELRKFINKVDDIGRVDRALQNIAKETKNPSLVMSAIRSGYYNKENLITEPKELLGKTVKVEDISTAQTEQVEVTKAEYLAEDKLSINDGQFIVRENGMTTDGTKALSMGSSDDTETKGLDKLTQVTGTMASVLDGSIKSLMEVDEDMGAITPQHKKYLLNLFEMYKKVMLDASKDVDLDITVFEDLDQMKGNRGFAKPDTGEIDLVLGWNQHTGVTEIFAEELQHVLIKNAFRKNPELYKQTMDLRKALAQKFDYNVFLTGIKDVTQEDVDIAKEKYEYAFHNERYPAEEFLAKITTNSQLVKALGTINRTSGLTWLQPKVLTAKERSEGKILPKWARIWNSIVKVLNNIYWSNKLGKESARELALGLMDTVMRAEHKQNIEEEKSLYQKSLDKISDLDKRVGKYTEAIKKEHANYAEYLADKEPGKLEKAINSLWRIKALSRVKSLALQNGLFTNVLMDTTNPDIAKIYEMFRHSKEFVNREVVALKKTTAKVLGETYDLNSMSKGKRKAIKRLLIDADAMALGNSKEILGYLEDENKLQTEYDIIVSKFEPNVVKAIEGLAELLVENRTSQRNVYTNAAQIALGEMGTTKPKIVAAINKAVSLLAIKNSPKLNKKLTVEALRENPKAIDHAMKLKALDEERVLEKAYNGDIMYMTKGAKQEHFTEDMKHYLVEAKEMKELVKGGLHSLGKHEELSKILGKEVYLVVGDSIEAGFTEGLISKIQFKSEGDSVKRILIEFNELTDEEASEVIEQYSKETGNTKEALIPERSGKGVIYDYKMRIPHNIKSKYLSLDDDIIHTIANTTSNLTHKQEAMLANKAAIKYLNKFYGMYKGDKKFKFIDVSEDSRSKLGKEYWETLPYYIKSFVKKNNKDGKLMVEESLLVHTFGYKDVSIINLPWVKDRVKRQLVAKKTEKVVKEIVSKWKQVIVTLTYSTIKDNILSNMGVALLHTKNKNPLKYLSKYQSYWEMMNEYQRDNSKLKELEVRRDAGEKISENKINHLNARLKGNFVHNIMMDGQYTSLLEDIDIDYFGKEEYLEGKLNKILSKPKNYKTRENLKNLIDTIYIRKDNKLFDSIMKLTLYSDAINKLIMLEDMMQKSKSKTITQNMLNFVDRLHVNYSYLDNKYLKWSNEIFLTFTKYTFRVLPAVVKMAQKKPVSVFTFESLNHLTGLDVDTPMEQYYNLLDTFQRKYQLWFDPIDVFKTILIPPIVK